jgi:NAD-dependent SIR2 family protein deacetylase
MKTAIFLGAGASKAEGAPLQNEIFKEYFKFSQDCEDDQRSCEMWKELEDFFKFMFGIDIIRDDLDGIEFPTFEEVLGMLDLAELRREAFRNFHLESGVRNNDRIRYIRRYLILAMAQIIHEKLKTSNGLHKELVKSLRNNGILKNTVFITTNYDILIDNALDNLMINYNVEFNDYNNFNMLQSSNRDSIKLLKLHGSLNWLYCPVCNTLTLTPREKGVIKLLTNIKEATCSKCNSIYLPLIVPPTYYKNMSNVFLSSVWHGTETELNDIDHIIFCGYSFSDADIHIKYLLKRIETKRNKELKISVFNYYKGKSRKTIEEEKRRFSRFFSKKVSYFIKSFEDFVSDPIQHILINI